MYSKLNVTNWIFLVSIVIHTLFKFTNFSINLPSLYLKMAEQGNQDSKDVILCADIGGTNSRFVLYEVTPNMTAERGEIAPGKEIFTKIYRNEHYPTFMDILKTCIDEANLNGKSPAAACLAVAGPVSNNAVTFTNREADGWHLDGNKMSRELNIPEVKLVNDFVALGYVLLTLNHSKECVSLQRAQRDPEGPIACLGAGTGLGETFLAFGPDGYIAYPTEGGHSDYVPKNALEWEMVEYLKNKFNESHRISNERIVSGPGLASVYEFLAQKFPERVDPAVQQALAEAEDLQAKVINENSKKKGSLCEQAMQIMISAYGYEAGVLGVKFMPTGGLYLAGGLTPKCIDMIKDHNGPFMKGFRDKGRVSGVLDKIPFEAVMEEDLGLRGSHLVAFKAYRKVKDLGLDQPQGCTIS